MAKAKPLTLHLKIAHAWKPLQNKNIASSDSYQSKNSPAESRW